MSDPIQPAPSSPTAPKTSGLAISSLALSILSLTCFSILTAIPGVVCGHMALGRIKRSGGALTGHGLAMAGLVIGYIGVALAIFVLPLMMAIAIPNFVHARKTAQKNYCINNLRMIQVAKKQWASENKKQPTDIPTAQDLAPYLPKGMPTCIAGGTYSINAVNTPPTCSIPEHVMKE